MPMNQVIQEKRRALGLTQEQVAECLSVSTPAVSKWEKGATCPDVALLPQLARLLKTDVNTLLCFREDLTGKDITVFCKQISELFHKSGFAAAYAAVVQKIREYPHNETLLYTMVLQLDGILSLSDLTGDEKQPYEKQLNDWYRRLADSPDQKIRNAANFMLVSRCIRRGEYDRAQEVLDTMPDRREFTENIADKLFLQIQIYQHQGKADKAAEDLQRALFSAVNKTLILLGRLADMELAAGNSEVAKIAAEKALRAAQLFEIPNNSALGTSLSIAQAEQDADTCMELLNMMLAAVAAPWDMGNTTLYWRVAQQAPRDPSRMLPAVLASLERDPAYDFLRDREDFKSMVDAYRNQS